MYQGGVLMAKVIFELSSSERRCTILPKQKIKAYQIDNKYRRQKPPQLPEIAEVDLVRHYTNLSKMAYGVDNGAYLLGSCTMKYNPKINEDIASLCGFSQIHPLQPFDTVKGALALIDELDQALQVICGMDSFTLQPAAGAHGEFVGLLMIKAYHHQNGQKQRNKIIIPDSAHGTNPASASMVNFKTVSVASNDEGGIDIDQLKQLVDDETAGLMLTNPNTLGLFDKNINEITKIMHDAGALVYYDGANLNAIMGICRPGDMGFDIVHLNLHKTFSTPHGGGGPGSGPIGCKAFLKPFLPKAPAKAQTKESIGQVRSFYGNFLVYVRALAYIKIMGKDGLKEVSLNAVLNANYLKYHLQDIYPMPYHQACMHEFVTSLQALKDKYQVSAKDVAKAMLDHNIHPPTMYFPLIVAEALMFEPTETESRETLDMIIKVMKEIHQDMIDNPTKLTNAPLTTPVSKLDEVQAARHPILTYQFNSLKEES